MYHHEHGVVMSTSAIAAMLSTILYYRRFFPYYVYNILGGLDDEGTACVLYSRQGCSLGLECLGLNAVSRLFWNVLVSSQS